MTARIAASESAPPGWLQRTFDQIVLLVFGAALAIAVFLLRLLRPKPVKGEGE